MKKTVKKTFTLLFAGLLAASILGCSGSGRNPNADSSSNPVNGSETSNPEIGGENSSEDGNSGAASSELEDIIGKSNILVAYFSATGTTESVAGYIEEITGADLFEIKPAEPYAEADLDYNDTSSRATREQNDDTCRPEMADKLDSIENYDIVFIGYPIWWGEEPRIIDTFLESYDWSGKVMINFCTSGSSGIGRSTENLKTLIPGARWTEGKRYGSGASRENVEEWIETLDLSGMRAEEMDEAKLGIQIGETVLTAVFEDNSSAEALIEELKKNPITIDMEDYAGFEKVGALGLDLPRNDTQITTEPGDVILYLGNQLTIYYDTNSWNFTRIAKIEEVMQEELMEILGEGDVTVTLFLQ